ncbi:PAS domain S-box protein [Candidatus Nitrospira salsa]
MKHKSDKRSPQSIEEDRLRQRLQEAEDTLEAIRTGAVDALVVEKDGGEQVYTLTTADHLYRRIVDDMAQGAVVMDIDGIILHCNTTFAQMVAQSSDSLLGLPFQDCLLEKDQSSFLEQLPLSQSHSQTNELTLQVREHGTLPVYISITSIQLSDSRVFCTILTDLTERKQHERILTEEKLSRSILEQTGEAIIVCDHTGRIIRASTASNRLCSKYYLFQPFDHMFPLKFSNGTDDKKSEKHNLTQASSLIDQLLVGTSVQGIDVRLELEDDKTFDLLMSGRSLRDDTGHIIGCVITLIDLTQQKQTETLALYHNHLLELVVKEMPLTEMLNQLCLLLEKQAEKSLLASILLLDQDGRHLRYGAGPSLPPEYRQATDGLAIGPAAGSCGVAAYRGDTVYTESIADDSNWREYKDLALSHGLRACWSTPILSHRSHVLGTFALYYSSPRLPTDSERQLLSLTSKSIAIAIERKQSQVRLLQQTHTLEAVNRIGSSLVAELDLQRLIQAVTDACTELIGAEFGAFFYTQIKEKGESYDLFSISGVPREAFQNFPMPRNTELFGPTFRGERIIRLDDVTQDQRYGKMAPHYGMPQGHLPVRSYLGVPVISRNGMVLGGLFFGHSQTAMFTVQDEDIIKGIAAQAAIAIDNANLYQSAQNELEERKRTEAQLAQLAFIVQSSQDAIIGATLDGTITSWNKGAEKLYGYSSDEILGEHYSRLLPSGYEHELPRIFEKLRNGEAVTSWKTERKKRDGTHVHVSLTISPIHDAMNQLIGSSAIERDISEQHHVEQALRESEHRLQAILDHSPAIVFLKDLSGHYRLLNKQLEMIFRLPPEQIIGRTDYELFPNSIAKTLCENDQKVLDTLIPIEFEESVMHSGAIHTYISIKFPLFDSNGKPYALCGVATDITNRKQAERELKELNETLEQRVADRTLALSNYQTHLRTMATELALTEQRERRRLATELHDYLAQLLVVCRMKVSQVNQEMQRSTSLSGLKDIDDILAESLTYTRTLIAELSPTILYEFGLVAALRWLGEQMVRHGLHVQVLDNDYTIQLPEDKAVLVYQSVRELLFNIVKHAGVPDAIVSIQGDRKEYVQVMVLDRGVGFHPSAQETKHTHTGKYGLFSIRERLEAIDGRLEIESAPGQGTRAQVMVPTDWIYTDDAYTSHSSAPSDHVLRNTQQRPNSQTIRILLVDDHALVRQGVRTLLENHKDFHVVGEATNGKEAIQFVKEVECPDIVIMDINMPIMNGIEASKIITHNYPTVSVIGLSVHEDSQLEASLYDAGAMKYISKGSVANELSEAIRSAFQSRPNA